MSETHHVWQLLFSVTDYVPTEDWLFNLRTLYSFLFYLFILEDEIVIEYILNKMARSDDGMARSNTDSA